LRLDDPADAAADPAALTQEMTWPKEIKKLPESLRVVWLDGHESHYSYSALRALCRCAGCTGGH
jgi:DUF971 family protein